MIRRTLCALLVLAMLLTGAATAETTYPLVDEPITIKVGVFGDVGGEPLVWTKISELTGIELEWVVIPWDQKQVFLMMNEWPDFFLNNFNMNDMNEWGVEAGWLANLLDYMEYMPNLAAVYEAFPEAKSMATMLNGAVYSFPNVGPATNAASGRWHYNYGILEELGLEVPTTLDEYYNVLVAIKEATGEAPIVDGPGPVHGYYSWAPAEAWNYANFGEDYEPNFQDDGNGKVEYGRIEDQYRAYLSFHNKLYEEGLIHQEYLTMDGSTRLSRIIAGQTVFGYYGFDSISDPSVFKNGWTDLRQLAPLDDSKTLAGQSQVSIPGVVINAKSPYIKEICQMMDILYSKTDVGGTGVYGPAYYKGVENVTWRFTDETKTATEELIPEGMEDVYTTPLNFKETYVVTPSSIGVADFDYLGWPIVVSDAEPTNNSEARFAGYNADMIPYQVNTLFPQGKMPMTAEETEIITLYETELRSHVTEWSAWFTTGKKDIDNDADWQEYVDGCYGLHLQELIDTYQAAYDRFLGK